MKTTPPADTALLRLQQVQAEQRALLQHIQHLERCILELKAELYDLNTPYGQIEPARACPLTELIAEQKLIMEARAKIKDLQEVPLAEMPPVDTLASLSTDKVRLQLLRNRLAPYYLEVAVDSCANGDVRYYLKPLTGRAAMVSDPKLDGFIKTVLHELSQGTYNKYLKSDQVLVNLITQALAGYALQLTDLNSGLSIVSEHGVLMSSPTPAELLPQLLSKLADGAYEQYKKA